MTKIEIYRKQANLTQDELAKKSKIGRRNIIIYESGKGNPTTKTLSKLAEALSCEVKDLL